MRPNLTHPGGIRDVETTVIAGSIDIDVAVKVTGRTLVSSDSGKE